MPNFDAWKLGCGVALALLGCSSEDKGGQNPVIPPEGGPTPAAAAARRASCGFEAGARTPETLGITDAERKKIPIEHVIVMMKENRSYDHLFGRLSTVDSKYEGIPDDYFNKDPQGNDVWPVHAKTTCMPNDPAHQWDEMHAQANGGKMDGFVKSAAATSDPPSDGHFVMGYYEESDIPFYYFLAKTFALADRNFPSVLSGTWPNRDYLYAATSDGVTFTNFPCPTADYGCIPHVDTLFDAMTKANVTWGAFSDSAALSFALEWTDQTPGVHKMQDFFDGLSAGTLPSVSFVDGRIGGVGSLFAGAEDDHPTADIQNGEKWSRSIYDAAVASPLWNKTAIFFTYDEAGGFFDHVPPPPYDAEKTKVCVARPDSGGAHPDSEFFELGIRVPLIAISPWAKRGYVSHVRHEHTSITRFIELLFNLPALTARDANSDALLDMFDFTTENTDPIPTAPSEGTGGCVAPDAGGAPDAGP